MSLVNLSELLSPANHEGYAVGAFDVFNVEMAEGVLRAAEALRSPLIFAHVERHESLISIEALAALLLKLGEKASIPVCLHLDHADNLAEVKKAIDCGFTSVMIDASELPLSENIAMTRQVVDMAHPLGVSVEAELGHVSGNETADGSIDDHEVYTEVNESVEFLAQTEVDALAISVGTVHGVYKSAPKLNFERCADIKKATGSLPLVLHGGSGLSDEDFSHFIRCGVNKINIFTDLTLAAVANLHDGDLSGKTPYFKLSGAVMKAIQEATEKKIRQFGSAGKA